LAGSHLAGSHHPAALHHAFHHLFHHSVVVSVNAGGAVGVPADEEPGEEGDREDEHNTGDDAYPYQDSVQPFISVIALEPRRLSGAAQGRCCGWFDSWRFRRSRCFCHVSIIRLPSWSLGGSRRIEELTRVDPCE
jgi:hypothetical protein